MTFPLIATQKITCVLALLLLTIGSACSHAESSLPKPAGEARPIRLLILINKDQWTAGPTALATHLSRETAIHLSFLQSMAMEYHIYTAQPRDARMTTSRILAILAARPEIRAVEIDRIVKPAPRASGKDRAE